MTGIGLVGILVAVEILSNNIINIKPIFRYSPFHA